MNLSGHDTYIFLNIRRCNRNLLMVNLFILMILLTTGFFIQRYLYNFFFGPFDIDNQTLTSIKDADSAQKYFYNVKGEGVQETGVRYIIQDIDKYTNKVKSERIEAYYHLLLVNEKFLIIKTPERRKRIHYTGVLVRVPEDVARNVIKSDIKSNTLPFMLDCSNFRTNGYIGLGIAIPILLIIIWNLIKFIMRNGSPENHPLYKKLALYGEPSDIASKIHDETMSQAVRTAYMLVTPTWFLAERFFTLDFEKLTDIMWIYKKITTQKAYGVITTAKFFELYAMTRSGKSMILRAKEKEVDEVIINICGKAPWIVAGYSNDLKNIWNSNRNHFIEQVDQKRSEMNKK